MSETIDLISEGREGVSLKLVASRLKQKCFSDEEIEELFDIYKQYPLNDKLKLTAVGIIEYMRNMSSIEISSEKAEMVFISY